MRTIEEYLSGNYDQELSCAVALERNWFFHDDCWHRPGKQVDRAGNEVPFRDIRSYGESNDPLFAISRDSCEELLADLTDHEMWLVSGLITNWTSAPGVHSYTRLLRATARQICVAYLITKNILQ
jgi:hypothetical protein